MLSNAKAFLFEEDRGVSPVIGVILMVAITVILAAVIATFVMNMGPSSSGPPNVQMEWNTDASGPYAVLSVEGGDPLPVGEYAVQYGGSTTPLENTDDASAVGGGSTWADGDEMTAGDSLTMDSLSTASGDEITLIWQNPNNDQTQTIDTYTVE